MRRSGVLLHPTSLPGKGGVGSIGQAARNFLGFLSEGEQRIWQMLPLVPTDDGGCPYNSTSAMAFNTKLVDMDDLCSEQFACLLRPEDLADMPDSPGRADFEMARRYKDAKMTLAWERLCERKDDAAVGLKEEFSAFCAKFANWLDDYALFSSLQEQLNEPLWMNWPKGLRDRQVKALKQARLDYASEIERLKFFQFLFFKQWQKLREVAAQCNVKIMGDIPIFVSQNSVDVWCNRNLFQLTKDGSPKNVSGAPPDYFCPEGQLWGNPLYDWNKLADTGYAWWLARLDALAELVDIVRIDHFRGFEAFWTIKAGSANAIDGKWTKGPGMDFFKVVKEHLPNLEVIAEDLGKLTPEVEILRKECGYPGMRIVQFGFPYEANDHNALHMYTQDSVAYTGTHDNDTIVGWWNHTLDEGGRDHVRRYLSIDGNDIAWQMIQAVMASVADISIIPVQDLLSLDSDARMNVPGVAKGNWGWRLTEDMPWHVAPRLRGFTRLYGRSHVEGYL